MSPEARLFDANGHEIVRERVRRAAGFLERYVREDEPPALSGVAPVANAQPGRWRDVVGGAGWREVTGEDPA